MFIFSKLYSTKLNTGWKELIGTESDLIAI